jgi:DNA ligase (NAD+)
MLNIINIIIILYFIIMRITKALIESIKTNPSDIVSKINDEDLEKLLRKFSDAYYNTNKPLIEDITYDILYDLLKERDPTNKFLRESGAKIKVDRKKVELKYPMGSLTKIKPNEGDLDPWINKYKGPYIISDKLDGVSAQIYKKPNGTIEMYTRGKGDESGNVGEDISHLLKYINIGEIKNLENDMSIRGELIIKRIDFDKIKDLYKNIRNTVSGVVNSKTVDIKIAKLVDFVAYSILNPEIEQEQQMKKLKEMKINYVEYKVLKKLDENILQDYLKDRRSKSDYDIDGIVVVDSSKIYKLKTGNPENAFAFKMVLDDQFTIAEVVSVNWDYSMDSLCKPTVTIKPVELVGVTITNATAHNADFIRKNKLGPGAKIKIIRSGDVIPKIMEVIEPAKKASMPDIPYVWNDTDVDIIIDYSKKVPQYVIDRVLVNVLIHFFSTLNIKYISEGILTKLVDNDYKNIFVIVEAFIDCDDDLSEIDGVGDKLILKISKEIISKLDKAKLYTFMDASHMFGKGIGSRKLKEILNVYPNIMNDKSSKSDLKDKIINIDGFANLTASRFVDNLEKFKKFYNDFNQIFNISHMANDLTHIKEKDKEKDKNKNKLKDQVIVFTGVRNKDIESKIEDYGGKISSSISKNTTILVTSDNPDTSTEKYKKAKSLNINIITVTQFITKYF